MNVLNASNTLRFDFQFEDFVDYVFFFYRDFPNYCSGGKSYRLWEVERAVKRYYKNIKDFDSIDRENVKYVMEAYRQAKPEQIKQPLEMFRATYQSMQHQQSIRKEQNDKQHNT
jgi:hypothetical protein